MRCNRSHRAFNGVLLILLCIYTQSSIENWLIYRLKSYFLYVRRSYYTEKRENHKNNRIYASVFHTHTNTQQKIVIYFIFTARVFRGNLFSPTKWKTAEKQRIESSTHLMYRDSLYTYVVPVIA